MHPSPGLPVGADVEVVTHAKRRQFRNAEKRRILAAAERCKPGELGALLRREGVYSSSLSTWRRQREAGELAALAPQKRGPKADPMRAEAAQITKLVRENERLRDQLEKARLIIDVQKNCLSVVPSPCWTGTAGKRIVNLSGQCPSAFWMLVSP